MKEKCRFGAHISCTARSRLHGLQALANLPESDVRRRYRYAFMARGLRYVAAGVERSLST